MDKHELEQRTKGFDFGFRIAESRNDFIHKIAIVEKEAAESVYWLELLEDSGIGNSSEGRWLLKECGELLAIFTAAGKTAKARKK